VRAEQNDLVGMKSLGNRAGELADHAHGNKGAPISRTTRRTGRFRLPFRHTVIVAWNEIQNDSDRMETVRIVSGLPGALWYSAMNTIP
jgi:hypothetical protein